MPDIYTNFLAGVLTADPGAVGTTLNSGNFAFMPAVAAPNTMRIVLEPEGPGVPEVCLVTAHTAFATSCTVTRGQEQGFGGSVARAHAVDSVWRHSLTQASIAAMIAQVTVPAATISATIASTPDPGYLFLDGSTVINAQVLYPATWARIPAAMKSGADMLLPDARGATLMMDDAGAVLTLAAVSGANARAIAQANLPAVGVTVDPPAASIYIDPPATTITVDPPLTNGPQLSPQDAWQFVTNNPAGPYSVGVAGVGGGAIVNFVPYTSVPNINIPPFDATVDIPGFTVPFDMAPFTSGNLGAGTALDTTPRNLCINFQIKVH